MSIINAAQSWFNYAENVIYVHLPGASPFWRYVARLTSTDVCEYFLIEKEDESKYKIVIGRESDNTDMLVLQIIDVFSTKSLYDFAVLFEKNERPTRVVSKRMNGLFDLIKEFIYDTYGYYCKRNEPNMFHQEYMNILQGMIEDVTQDTAMSLLDATSNTAQISNNSHEVERKKEKEAYACRYASILQNLIHQSQKYVNIDNTVREALTTDIEAYSIVLEKCYDELFDRAMHSEQMEYIDGVYWKYYYEWKCILKSLAIYYYSKIPQYSVTGKSQRMYADEINSIAYGYECPTIFAIEVIYEQEVVQEQKVIYTNSFVQEEKEEEEGRLQIVDFPSTSIAIYYEEDGSRQHDNEIPMSCEVAAILEKPYVCKLSFNYQLVMKYSVSDTDIFALNLETLKKTCYSDVKHKAYSQHATHLLDLAIDNYFSVIYADVYLQSHITLAGLISSAENNIKWQCNLLYMLKELVSYVTKPYAIKETCAQAKKHETDKAVIENLTHRMSLHCDPLALCTLQDKPGFSSSFENNLLYKMNSNMCYPSVIDNENLLKQRAVALLTLICLDSTLSEQQIKNDVIFTELAKLKYVESHFIEFNKYCTFDFDFDELVNNRVTTIKKMAR